MAESSFMQPAIPKFDGHYDHWSMLMENLLRSKEYWSVIEDGVVVAPANATAEQRKTVDESKLKDLKAKNYLFQAIDRTILETILNRDTARDIWISMHLKYQGSTKVKRAQLQALRREFEILAMKETESVDEYLSRTLAIANKMTAYGETMDQVKVVEKVLRSMTSKFNYVVCSIEESNDVTKLTIDELQSSLLVHEQRMQFTQEKDEEKALQISAGRGGGRGRGGNSVRESLQVKVYDDSHMEIWFLDSGCSNHMVGRKDWLFNFDDNFRETVKVGDNSKMSVMGKGNLKLQIGGITQVITEVYYLPGLKNNLLSIGQLQQKNLTIIFSNDICKVYHESKGLIMSTQMSANRMYKIHASVLTLMCMQVTKMNETQLWHLRYGHLNYKGLSVLTKKEMVKGLPVLQETNKTCKDCIVGRQHRNYIPKNANWRASEKLQLVHSDICGPIKPTSNGGSRYLITFTDDFSRKTWSYVLTEKANVLSIFKKFKASAEKESNCQLKCLRTDRSGEFTSTVFNEFYSKNDIKRQLTAAYTPQHNGVSERKNRTIMNMVRSMLAGKSVPKRFWPEAVLWATYVLNRSPTMSVKEMTPEEAWSNVKPSVHHFKVFGCLAYAHVADVQRKKLDPRSIKCVHLGVSEDSKAYKLYDPVNKKIIISRDVIFDETKGWEWNGKIQQRQDYDVEEIVETSGTASEDENEIAHPDIDEQTVEHVSDTESEKIDNIEQTPVSTPRTRGPSAWTRDFVKNSENVEDEGGKVRFGIDNCKSVCSPIVPSSKLIKDEGGKLVNATEYRRMIGCLMYLLARMVGCLMYLLARMIGCLMYLVASYMESPTELHLATAERYLKDTIGIGVWYKKMNKEAELQGWTDSDYACDLDDMKNSTSGYIFAYGAGPISWSSKK
ncbi:unnamed protein product [Trifolium pratense]|uniref:Uncharacterized protein n=1 Tax=Trifolium pratense TaxID=57577 RepID=A0ACB0IQU9_TRIPR|nr:unnamed protein product [Trifolium pratense]